MLLSALGTTPEKIDESELPDFMLTMHGRTVGVEVTMYQSGTTVGGAGFERRQVEAAWESLQLASREFRAAQPDISKVNVGLMFYNVVPPRGEHQQFMEEIAAFIRNQEIRSERTRCLSHEFASPLMKKYLHTLVLNKSEFAEWYSNITSGWVAGPDSTLNKIVAEKAARTYRPSDELWSIIQCSHRISEIVLPLSVDALNAISMQGRPFSKIYLLAIDGVFQWDQLTGWTAIRLDIGNKPTFSTFDEMKATFTNPELSADPHGWCKREVKKSAAGSHSATSLWKWIPPGRTKPWPRSW